jgi:hypothetical protein
LLLLLLTLELLEVLLLGVVLFGCSGGSLDTCSTNSGQQHPRDPQYCHVSLRGVHQQQFAKVHALALLMVKQAEFLYLHAVAIEGCAHSVLFLECGHR